MSVPPAGGSIIAFFARSRLIAPATTTFARFAPATTTFARFAPATTSFARFAPATTIFARFAPATTIFARFAPATPPDVRQGYALPVSTSYVFGYAPGSGFALRTYGQRPNRGHSPIYILGSLTARQSLASHQAAKPERKARNLRYV
jgi:hypothetical protein